MTTVADQIRSVADLAGRRVVVLGLARSGIAAARMLVGAGALVTAYDRRPASELGPEVGELDGRGVTLLAGAAPAEVTRLLAAAELVVTSPSISARFPTTDAWLREALSAAARSGVPVMGEVDLFLTLTRARVLGVTGTKGKTTTTALIGAILESAGIPHLVGGNIGRPLIEEVGRLTSDDWAVLELSELQLPSLPRGVEIAVYTNIGADHLDRHGSVEAYRAVKARLGELSAARGTVLLNADDPGCRELGARLSGDLRWYGLDDPDLASTAVTGTIILEGSELMPVADVPLPGRHMLGNVLAAALAGRLAGAAPPAITDAIRSFPGVPHRLETIVERDGVRWVNDSQATIPLAAAAALDAFAAPVVLIAGGQGKGLDLGEFVERAVARCRAVVLIGETADELEQRIAGRVPVRRAGGMPEAVRDAAALARAGDVVILAPAATSFDMFVDYAARGDAFRAEVQNLIGTGGDA
jgi:UDP-N-acetylmuramoylalanine--D-glutamate ligase